jgi:Tol biopolymer transport system component
MVMPTWSPDGSQIAWAESSGGSKERIWLASSNGSNAHPVTQPIDALFQFAWLPSKQLLYDANFSLFRLPLKTLRPVLFEIGPESFTTNRTGTISASGSVSCSHCGGPIIVKSITGDLRTSIGGRKVDNYLPTLSPDGRLVAFSRTFWSKAAGEYDQPAGIWVSSTAGGPLRQLTRSGQDPSWSPDGRRLVYLDRRPNNLPYNNTLRLVSTNGRSNVLLLRGNVLQYLSSPPMWSADSRSVALVSDTGQLLVVNVATHRAKAVTETAIGRVDGFAWSPNSNTLLVTAQSKTTGCALWAIKASGSTKLLRRTC